MSKNKKKQQKQVFMSPEKYIRQKSRNLPIVRCIINKDWDKTGIANLIIARQHSNGNFTFCVYLVDKECLGVKDTAYWFNEPQETLDKYEESMTSSFEVEEISYDLAHNIILAAVEFAEDYGFKPHRDFTSITQYFLEEDTDDIPLIEIHCGNKEGKPKYVNTGRETPAQQKQIINQLEKTAGKGNFDIMINAEDIDLDKDASEDVEEDVRNKTYWYWRDNFEEMPDEDYNVAVCETISEWTRQRKKRNRDYEGDELFDKMRALTDLIAEYEDLYDQEKADGYYKQIIEDLGNIDTVATNDVPNSLFPTFERDGKELSLDFLNALFEIYTASEGKMMQQALDDFFEKYNDCEAFAYLKFIVSIKIEKNGRVYVEKALEKFPDYFLFRLYQKEKEIENMSLDQKREELLNLVKGRTLTTFEKSHFAEDYVDCVFDYMNTEAPDHLEKLFALEMLYDSDSSGENNDFSNKSLLLQIRLYKINLIALKIMEKKTKD